MSRLLSYCIFILLMAILPACNWDPPQSEEGMMPDTTKLSVQDALSAKIDSPLIKIDSTLIDSTTTSDNAQNKDTAVLSPTKQIDIKNVVPEEVMKFAETLMGTPYVYGSTNPKVGFDCSGFITYVFSHFGLSVPRSSIDFTNVGKQIPVEQAKRGDIILFTGTNPLERHVGHMGLIVSNKDSLHFIHSTSGKAMGVTITPLNKYYVSRFVKTLRIFPQND